MGIIKMLMVRIYEEWLLEFSAPFEAGL